MMRVDNVTHESTTADSDIFIVLLPYTLSSLSRIDPHISLGQEPAITGIVLQRSPTGGFHRIPAKGRKHPFLYSFILSESVNPELQIVDVSIPSRFGESGRRGPGAMQNLRRIRIVFKLEQVSTSAHFEEIAVRLLPNPAISHNKCEVMVVAKGCLKEVTSNFGKFLDYHATYDADYVTYDTDTGTGFHADLWSLLQGEGVSVFVILAFGKVCLGTKTTTKRPNPPTFLSVELTTTGISCEGWTVADLTTATTSTHVIHLNRSGLLVVMTFQRSEGWKPLRLLMRVCNM